MARATRARSMPLRVRIAAPRRPIADRRNRITDPTLMTTGAASPRIAAAAVPARHRQHGRRDLGRSSCPGRGQRDAGDEPDDGRPEEHPDRRGRDGQDDRFECHQAQLGERGRPTSLEHGCGAPGAARRPGRRRTRANTRRAREAARRRRPTRRRPRRGSRPRRRGWPARSVCTLIADPRPILAPTRPSTPAAAAARAGMLAISRRVKSGSASQDRVALDDDRPAKRGRPGSRTAARPS